MTGTKAVVVRGFIHVCILLVAIDLCYLIEGSWRPLLDGLKRCSRRTMSSRSFLSLRCALPTEGTANAVFFSLSARRDFDACTVDASCRFGAVMGLFLRNSRARSILLRLIVCVEA